MRKAKLIIRQITKDYDKVSKANNIKSYITDFLKKDLGFSIRDIKIDIVKGEHHKEVKKIVLVSNRPTKEWCKL